MAEIISLAAHRQRLQAEYAQKALRTDALARLENSKRNVDTFNHEFYKLVDLFLRENYPDAFWRFDVWLDKVRKGE